MTQSTRTFLSIVIPVYNEEDGLPALFERIQGLIDSLNDVDVEVLFVDDHSSDKSPVLLKNYCTNGEHFRFMRLAANSGSHIAVFAGLEHARGDCAVFLAADLQDPPELIPKMLDLWRQGYRAVWAVRERRKGIPASEMLFANTFYWLMNHFSHITVPPKGSDFALVDHKVIDALSQSASASPYLMGEIARLGFSQTQILYTKEERKHGQTKWNLERKLRLVADAFVGFSYVPMRLMSYLGVICSMIGFAYALLIIVLRLGAGNPGEGWASLMVVVLLISGFQMTMLGILGEYLWRTLEEARSRPGYFIEDSSDLGDPRVPSSAPYSRPHRRRAQQGT